MVQRAERLSGSPNNREADLASASSPSPPPRGHLDEWLRSLGRPPQPGEVTAHLATLPSAAREALTEELQSHPQFGNTFCNAVFAAGHEDSAVTKEAESEGFEVAAGLAKKRKSKPVAPSAPPPSVSSPQDVFENDVLGWAARNEKHVDRSIKNMLHALIDAAQLILARPPKTLKRMIVDTLLDEIPMPFLANAAKETITVRIQYVAEQDAQADEGARQSFIDDIQNYIRQIDQQGILQQAIAQAAGGLMLQVHSAAPEQRLELIRQLKPQLKDAGAIPEDRVLASILKVYWKWGAGAAQFRIPTGQGARAIMPVAPDRISNWEDIVCAIQEGDPEWDTLDYDISVEQEGTAGQVPRVYKPGDPQRKAVVDWIVENRAMLEQRISPEAKKRCKAQRAKRRLDRTSGTTQVDAKSKDRLEQSPLLK